MNSKIKFIYWGTPEIASETLDILKKYDFKPTAIVTNPDRPVGRGLALTPSPVAIWAIENDVPCLKPEKIDTHFINTLSEYNVDLNIVVAYGKILPKEIVNMTKFGTLNIHYSLLPKYRGASPIEQALLNADSETGVTIQKMVEKMDAGPIVAKKIIPIDINTTKEILRKRLIKEGGDLLSDILPKYISGKIEHTPQDESLVTMCKKIKKEDGEIDIDDAGNINWGKYRAYSGWPGVFFFKDKKRIKISKAEFEDGNFIIKRIIPEGKKEQDYLL